MVNQNIPNGNNLNPFLSVNQEVGAESNLKVNEDQYAVYVNGNLVGHKALKTQGEKLSDIDEFLQRQGINDFTATLDGGQYIIEASENNADIRDALSVYFQNR